MPSETDVLVLEQMFWIGTVVTGVQITKHSGTKDMARSILALAGRGLWVPSVDPRSAAPATSGNG